MWSLLDGIVVMHGIRKCPVIIYHHKNTGIPRYFLSWVSSLCVTLIKDEESLLFVGLDSWIRKFTTLTPECNVWYTDCVLKDDLRKSTFFYIH